MQGEKSRGLRLCRAVRAVTVRIPSPPAGKVLTLKKEKGKGNRSLNFPNPSLIGPSCPPTFFLAADFISQRRAAWLRGPALAAHHEVAGFGVEASTLGPGDTLKTTEDEAGVALTALHASVLAGHAREAGMAGVRAQLGAHCVLAVGWAGQSWWREKHRREVCEAGLRQEKEDR